MADQGALVRIKWDQLRLDMTNYRHEKMRTPNDAILYHLQKERVLELALDIAREGLNPMERLGVVKLPDSGDRPSYTAVEGNRRACALMLLHDPQKVPSGYADRGAVVRRLIDASKKANLPKEMDCIVFSSKKAAKPWIDRMHLGEMDGRGRKAWRSDQTERAMEGGGGRNRDAMAILDLAEKFGLITKSERSLKLTTVQRYVGNPTMRHYLGIERDENGVYYVNRPVNDFIAIFEQFIEDIKLPKVLSSRSDASQVIAYAVSLLEKVGAADNRTERLELSEIAPKVSGKVSEKSDEYDTTIEPNAPNLAKIRPRTRAKIGINHELEVALSDLQGDKLISLYRSCAESNLKLHTPLITVGMWSLLESLAGMHQGHQAGFAQYFKKDFITKVGIGDIRQRNDIWDALQTISANGNATKHSAIAANFDGQQLANGLDVITPFLIAVCRQISATREEDEKNKHEPQD